MSETSRCARPRTREDAHAEERRSFYIADVPLLTFCLRLLRRAKSRDHPASNPLDEFLFL
jgi:hypothetical protein